MTALGILGNRKHYRCRNCGMEFSHASSKTAQKKQGDQGQACQEDGPMTFFRFPHTPHLAWLGKGKPRDDKVLGPDEAAALLACPITVEEKVDGANVGLSIDEHGNLRAQNRGSYLTRDASHPQFKPLFRWLDLHGAALEGALFPDLILFGEWCYAVHSVPYDRLPDWFLAFDVYDRARRLFWSVPRRDALVRQIGLAIIPRVASGRFDLAGLQGLFGASKLGNVPAEGLYLRVDEGDHLVARAKLVRAEFAQAIDEHWSKRTMRTNQKHDCQFTLAVRGREGYTDHWECALCGAQSREASK